MKKNYTNGDITVAWNPDICIHAGNCASQLGSVFNPNAKPWINMEGATSEEIVAQVGRCPSGALSIAAEVKEEEPVISSSTIQVLGNGPLRVAAPCVITLPDGSVEAREKDAFLCRCGHSANKPYCDGAHKREGFIG